MKPDNVSQEAWDAAEMVGAAIHGRHERGWVMWPLISEDGNPAQEIVARAITAAVAAEREACAQAVLDCTVVRHGFHYTPSASDYANAVRVCRSKS